MEGRGELFTEEVHKSKADRSEVKASGKGRRVLFWMA